MEIQLETVCSVIITELLLILKKQLTTMIMREDLRLSGASILYDLQSGKKVIFMDI